MNHMTIADTLRVLQNHLDMSTRVYRKTTPNWVVVGDLILQGTSTAGCASCYEECRRIGIDPDGYELKRIAGWEHDVPDTDVGKTEAVIGKDTNVPTARTNWDALREDMRSVAAVLIKTDNANAAHRYIHWSLDGQAHGTISAAFAANLAWLDSPTEMEDKQ